MSGDYQFANQEKYDYLTGLPSMTYFFELAEIGRDAIRGSGQRPAMLFIDVNGMKSFNQNQGFEKGDQLLVSLSMQLIHFFGAECSCRLGQDQFGVFAPEQGLEEKLGLLFAACRTFNGGNSRPLRVGIFRDWPKGVSAVAACDRAKLACDVFRGTYESAWCDFEPSMLEAMERRQYIVANLDRAIAQRWICVYYQPIIRAVNGRVCEEEALVRWNDPQFGLLPPDQFIPILEESRLAYKLDLIVLEQVLEKLAVMEKAGLPLVPQSVNLSRTDFEVCDMVEEVRRRVDASGFARSLITVEITESTLGQDFDFMKEQIERFLDLGFPVWMDDFGSGYSSLDVLQSVRFSLIKFDMKFMQNLDANGQNGRIILTELMKMATALSVDTVCEGVETSEQVHFLQEIGCSKLQGYYFTKPIPLPQVLERYRSGTQIGFENPRESGYYETVGRLNLYDLSTVTRGEQGAFRNYFSMLPMAVFEVHDGRLWTARSNPSYRQLMEKQFGVPMDEVEDARTLVPRGLGPVFVHTLMQCAENGVPAFIDEQTPDGSVVHSFVRRVAQNAVTGRTALVAAVLSVSSENQGVVPGVETAAGESSGGADALQIQYVSTREKDEAVSSVTFVSGQSPEGSETIVPEVQRVLSAQQKNAADDPEERLRFQALADLVAMPSCILSVEHKGETAYGEIRVVCANEAYRKIMGPVYYDGIRYCDMVPRDNKFEDFCFRSAVLGQRMRAYVETRALGGWTDQTLIPLASTHAGVGYCQFIFEVTKTAEPWRMASVSHRTAETVIQACIRLMSTEDYHTSVGHVLDLIMEFSRAAASRVMLYDRAGESAVTLCERADAADWPMRDPDADVITYELMQSWEAMLGDSNAIVLKNSEDMQLLSLKNPAWKATLDAHGVRSLILVPLRRSTVVEGYLYIVNFDATRYVEVKEAMELISFFLASKVSNHLLMERLARIGHIDALTGIQNRRAMIERVRFMEADGARPSCGVLSVDVNGLKSVNDRYGHEAGDHLIIRAGELIKAVFGSEDLFRTGGNEFIVITTDLDRETFEQKTAQLREDMEKDPHVFFSIGAYWTDEAKDMKAAFRMADEMMYEDKKDFYEKRPELKRRG